MMSSDVLESTRVGRDEMDQKNTVLDRESEQKSGTKELPEFLKQKLIARGVLQVESEKSNPSSTDKASFSVLVFDILSFNTIYFFALLYIR